MNERSNVNPAAGATAESGVQVAMEEQFRSDLLSDYRWACISREASLLGRKEVLGGKAKFGIFGDGKEVAQLALARETWAQAAVRAPFDGLVQSRHGSAPGASVRVGDALVTIVRTDPLRFRGTVPERQALKLREGQPVTVQLDGSAEPIRTAVAQDSRSVMRSERPSQAKENWQAL